MNSCDEFSEIFILDLLEIIQETQIFFIVIVENTLKTQINIFVETVWHFQDILMIRKKERHLFCNIINVNHTVTFD